MNVLAQSLAVGITLLSMNVFAEEFPACESQLFSQYQLLSKTSVSIPKHEPREDLLVFVHRYEMLCPWQLEMDFNNDRKTDWVGIVNQQNQYSLVAYLSGKTQYQAVKLKDYSNFPKSTFLEVIGHAEATQLVGDGKKTRFSRFAIQENEIGGKSQLYIWDGQTINMIQEFKNNLKIEPEQPNEEEELEDESNEKPSDIG